MKTINYISILLAFAIFISCEKEKTQESPSPCNSSKISYEGVVYHTVSIGNQCWMKENLNVGLKIDGSIEQTNNNIIEKYCYNNEESLCNTYGGMYKWDEIMSYTTTEGIRGICPEGWHIPTDAEWTTLSSFLGGDTVAGGKLKESGITHWQSPNTGAYNSSGFNGLPAGYYRSISHVFDYIGRYSFYWSSTIDGSEAWFRFLASDDKNLGHNKYLNADANSVRCIQD